MKFFSLIILFVHPAIAMGGYTPTELFVINWGDSPIEFVSERGGRIDPGTPNDPTDDYADPGSGPLDVFIDYYDNIVIVCPDFQLKGFTSDGTLLFDFSAGSPDFVEGMFWGGLDKLYVDTSKHIYLTTAWPMPYVPKINYETGTVDSLKPFDSNPDELINDMNWTYDGRILFLGESLEWITINQNQRIPGGTWGVRLSDGRNYYARLMTADTVKIFSTINPDVQGHGTDKVTTFIRLGVGNLTWVEMLKSMDPSHFYLLVGYFTDVSYYETWQYDLQYNLVDKVIPPAEQAYYSSAPKPFITANGDIYEFRARSDGLHVIKWTKQ